MLPWDNIIYKLMRKEFQMKNLYKIILLCLSLASIPSGINAQDTFSIVAVDTVTGEIGSAGASCVTYGSIGAFIISDVIEGIGGIHTQAYWNNTNQDRAHGYMVAGYSPQQIIDSIVANDAEGNPTIRQYGVVDLTRRGESAAYTGVNTQDYKGHATGLGYSIQGNILLGALIIDTMKTTFLNTEGALADRLMKTLQAAKIVGADTRCISYGTSSKSAFIKVVRIGDNGNFYLQEIVPSTTPNVDPIDLLQDKFDLWKINKLNVVDPFLSEMTISTDTLIADDTSKAVITIIPKNNSDTLLAPGLTIQLMNTGAGTLGSVTDLGNGLYEAEITAPNESGSDTISAIIISATDTVIITAKVVVNYLLPSSVDDYSRIAGFYLFDNYPNPFNPSTTIKFRVPNLSIGSNSGRGQFITLKIYDLLGNEMRTLVSEVKQPGEYEIEFNASDLSSGMYFYRLQSGSVVHTKKMMILK
jgi:uncharacterized Ntn-hydrolase superfamily protein